ncbi:MAG: VOC family protein [Fibrobacter sp.]|uniref:VOC family protein n=1 Tax=Fibrobacter sp. TaxID=35828 RepID=UPI0025B82224|nr:VOC family protein [Fibrobacter sp.]MBR4785978.1 VOC family protein [Fibrobacter sp.]
MRIEHIAIWAKDIDQVCEFYRKYFGGVVQPLYHNPAKQFTSRFVTFESGARLEIMHRPDIEGNAETVGTLRMFAIGKPIATLIASVIKHTSMFCDSRLIRFHVKHSQTEDATKNSFFGISEVQQVAVAQATANMMAGVAEHLGFAHISFSVGSKEEVDRLTQKMSEDGIAIVGEPRTTGDGYYESVVLDPEGNRIEITV